MNQEVEKLLAELEALGVPRDRVDYELKHTSIDIGIFVLPWGEQKQ